MNAFFNKGLFIGIIVSFTCSCTRNNVREYEVRYWKVYPDIFQIPPAFLRQADTLVYYRQVDTLEVIGRDKRYRGVDSISRIFYKYDSLIFHKSQLIENDFSGRIDSGGNFLRFEKGAHYTLKLQDTAVIGYGIEIYPTDYNVSDMVIFVNGYGAVLRSPYARGRASKWFLEKVDRIKGDVLQQSIRMDMLEDDFLQGKVQIKH